MSGQSSLPGFGGVVGMNPDSREDAAVALGELDGGRTRCRRRADGDDLRDSGADCPVQHTIHVCTEPLVIEMRVSVDEGAKCGRGGFMTWPRLARGVGGAWPDPPSGSGSRALDSCRRRGCSGSPRAPVGIRSPENPGGSGRHASAGRVWRSDRGRTGWASRERSRIAGNENGNGGRGGRRIASGYRRFPP